MSNWKYTIDLSDFYHKYPDELYIEEVGVLTSEKIKKFLDLSLNKTDEDSRFLLEDLIYEFSEIEDVDHFDSCMSTLYDWGDTVLKCYPHSIMKDKMCWIKTQ